METQPIPQGQGANFLRIDLATGKAESLFQNQRHVRWGVSLSPDGKTIFYSEPSRLIRFDLEIQRETEMQKIGTGVNSFYSVALSPDGKQLAYIFGLEARLIRSCLYQLPAARRARCFAAMR